MKYGSEPMPLLSGIYHWKQCSYCAKCYVNFDVRKFCCDGQSAKIYESENATEGYIINIV
jgi:hypothetical protein